MQLKENLGKYAAEAIATFTLVFCGTGAIAANEISGGAVTHVGVSLVFGLVILAMIYSVGHISGAHMNPAVSLAFTSVGRLSARELPLYWTAQVLGGLTASGMVRIIFPTSTTLGRTTPAGSSAQSFILEFVLTLILMFVIMGVAHDERAEGEMAGIAIGSTVTLEALLGGPISGASMNPIRSIAPAIVSNHLGSLWIYLIAPTLGALAGATLYRAVRCKSNLISTQVREDVMQKIKVLFVCIHNSARSQMAEALLKKIGGSDFEAESAGLEPGKLNPLAIEAMADMGIDISKNPTKRVFDMFKEGRIFNYVVTVCDETSAERCPTFPGVAKRVHWSFSDPSGFQGSHDEKLAGTIAVRNEIKAKIEEFVKAIKSGGAIAGR